MIYRPHTIAPNGEPEYFCADCGEWLGTGGEPEEYPEICDQCRPVDEEPQTGERGEAIKALLAMLPAGLSAEAMRDVLADIGRLAG